VGYARSPTGTQEDGPFTRAYGRATWYKPLGASWYATVRAEAGQVFVADNIGVPDPLLFRAGGDESVRGYGYRTLGPTVGGAVVSGRVLFTGSAEVARPISSRQPAFWWALFVDGGNAAFEWKDLSPVFGYGVGLRWRSPVGPLRLDLAYGQEVRKFRAHLSVGIAF
jgi:translocation and assembly module TamA